MLLPQGGQNHPPDRAPFWGPAGSWWPGALKILLVMLAFLVLRQWRPLDNYYPVLWPDGWGYLIPALRWINDGAQGTIYGRTFGYPLFLAVVLQVSKSFLVLGLVQRVLNLLGIWLVLSAAAHIYRQDGGPAKLGLAWLLTLSLLWLLMANPGVLLYEHYIQPEGLAPFGMGWLFFLSWLTARRLMQGRPWFWPLAGLALSNVAIYFIKPNWGFAVASPLALLLLLKAAHPTKLLKPALAYALVFLALFAPLSLWQKHLSRHDPAAHTFVPTTLFTWHLDGIKGLLEEDLRKEHPPFDRALVSGVNRMLERQFQMDRNRRIWYPSLGYNPDEIFYSPQGYGSVPELRKLGPQERKAFFMHYYWRYVFTRPWVYAKHIGGQLAVRYSFGAQLYPTKGYRETGEVKTVLQGGSNLTSGEDRLGVWQDYMRGLGHKIQSEVLFSIQVTPFKETVYRVLQAVYHPTMLAVLGLFVLLAAQKRRRGRNISPSGLFLALLSLSCWAAAFLSDLTAATAHSLDIARYFDFHYLLTITSQVLGAAALVWTLLDWRRGHGASPAGRA